jgi:hypothetical protein
MYENVCRPFSAYKHQFAESHQANITFIDMYEIMNQ